MSYGSLDKLWIKKVKWLTQVLIISGTLNIGLISTFVYFVFKEKQLPIEMKEKPSASKKIASSITLKQVIESYSKLSFQELLLRLENKDFVEEGYFKRDLALSSLVAFQHFNLERALGGLAIQKRLINFFSEDGQEKFDVTLFPGLVDYHFEAIIQYARTERWPLTTKGLFIKLKENAAIKDSSLVETFFLTPEFYYFYALFVRSQASINKEMLAQILLEGNWSTLERLSLDLKKTSDFSQEQRRAFLMQYISEKSLTAAQALIQIDYEFALKKLDDAQVVCLLDVLGLSTPENFAKELLASHRSDAVWNRATSILNKLNPELLNKAIVAPVVEVPKPPVEIPKQAKIQKRVEKEQPKKKQKLTHTIQPGDNLWKIARKYKVSVEALIRLNRLDSDFLRVGKQLEIPIN